ncbi:MAG: hypothetical protein ACJASU_001181 [Cognaticolwellia sp.]|jgi:hypothetical protein
MTELSHGTRSQLILRLANIRDLFNAMAIMFIKLSFLVK